MEGVFNMNGKTVEVVEYNLTFGGAKRFINVFGCFKYKNNGNLYVVYADVNSSGVLYYGSSHIKNNIIVSMSCKQSDESIIKEYIDLVINKKDLSNFSSIDLKEITGIELISSNQLELTIESIGALKNSTIPVLEEKREVKIVKSSDSKKKDKKGGKLILILVIFVVILGGYFYLSRPIGEESTKKIVCSKEEGHRYLNANLSEVNTYNFSLDDELESIDVINIYKFKTEEDYFDFINTGEFYDYMPDNKDNGGWSKDDNLYYFKIVFREYVDVGYKLPEEYDEVYSYYTNDGYSCIKEVEE